MKITISGTAGEGKTTLAFALECFLLNNGFVDVTVDDSDMKTNHGRTCEFNDMCMEAIGERHTHIHIETVQVKKS